MIDYTSIGKRISYYRKQKHLTQAMLAEKLDRSIGVISQVERGRSEVSLKRLDAIAEILEIDISKLISNTNQNSLEFGNSELLEITSGWSTEQKSMLIKILRTANEEFYNNKKEKK